MDKVKRLQNTRNIREIIVLKNKITLQMLYVDTHYLLLNSKIDVDKYLELFMKPDFWFDSRTMQTEYDLDYKQKIKEARAKAKVKK